MSCLNDFDFFLFRHQEDKTDIIELILAEELRIDKFEILIEAIQIKSISDGFYIEFRMLSQKHDTIKGINNKEEKDI